MYMPVLCVLCARANVVMSATDESPNGLHNWMLVMSVEFLARILHLMLVLFP